MCDSLQTKFTPTRYYFNKIFYFILVLNQQVEGTQRVGKVSTGDSTNTTPNPTQSMCTLIQTISLLNTTIPHLWQEVRWVIIIHLFSVSLCRNIHTNCYSTAWTSTKCKVVCSCMQICRVSGQLRDQLCTVILSVCNSLCNCHISLNASISLNICQFNLALYETLNLSSCATNQ